MPLKQGSIRTLEILPDGKVLAAGSFTEANNVHARNLVRYNADGTVDTSFQTGTGITVAYNMTGIHTFCVQPDGKILAGGFFDNYNGETVMNLICLHANGSLDTSFNNVSFKKPFMSDALISAITLQNDGKMIIAGSFIEIDGEEHNNLGRLSIDGIVDTTFAVQANNRVTSMVRQTDGGLLISGWFTQVNGIDRPGLARLNADGTFDAQYAPALPVNAKTSAITTLADGQTLVFGSHAVSGVWQPFCVKLTSVGSQNFNFSLSGVSIRSVSTVRELPDGKIFVTGIINDNDQRLGHAVLSESGTYLPQHENDFPPNVHDLKITSDDKIFIGGSFNRLNDIQRIGIALLNREFEIDMNWIGDVSFPEDIYGTTYETIRRIVPLKNGGTALLGTFGSLVSDSQRMPAYRFGLLNSAGGLNKGFKFYDVGDRFFYGTEAVAELSNGDLLLGANLNSSKYSPGVFKVNSSGVLDENFHGEKSEVFYPNDIAVLPDGSFYLAGRGMFSSDLTIQRHHADGSLNTNFSYLQQAVARRIQWLPENKLLLAGDNYFVKLYLNGDMDANFISPQLNGAVYSFLVLPGGRTIIAGNFTTVNGQFAGRVARLLPNGQLDSSFNIGTGASAFVRDITRRADGELILTGDFTLFNGQYRKHLAQLSADGELRSGFNPLPGPDAPPSAISLDASGKLLVGGKFTSFNGIQRTGLARVEMMPIGAVQPVPLSPKEFVVQHIGHTQTVTTWQETSGAVGYIIWRKEEGSSNWEVVGRLDADARSYTDNSVSPGMGYIYRVVAWNDGGESEAVETNRIVIPEPELIAGTPLPGDTLDLWNHGDITAIARQQDGKIIVGGNFTRVHGNMRRNLARLNADGSLDASFQPPSIVSTPLSLLVLPDGKILLGASFSEVEGHPAPGIARLLSNGTLDTSFNPVGLQSGVVYSMVRDDNGGIWLGGRFNANTSFLERLTSDGQLDADFFVDIPMGIVRIIKNTADGKFVIAGDFPGYKIKASGVEVSTSILRYNADGARDSTLPQVILRNNSGGNFVPSIESIETFPGSTIVVAGNFTHFFNQSIPRLIRLNANGTLDSSFAVGEGPSGNVREIVNLGNDRIALIGTFWSYQGIRKDGFAVINQNGALADAEMKLYPPYGTTGLADGQGGCWVGGAFSSANEQRRQSMAKYSGDTGSVDAAFYGSFSRAGSVSATKQLSDGSVILAGSFTSIGGPDDIGTPAYRILKLTPEGTLDNTFNVGSGHEATVNTIAEGHDGKIWIGGGFSRIGERSMYRVAKLHANGSLDESFLPDTTTTSGIVNAVLPESDGSVILGGSFTIMSGEPRSRIARLAPTGALLDDFGQSGASGTVSVLRRDSAGRLLVGGSFTSIAGSGPYLARLNTNTTADLSFNANANGSVQSILLEDNGRLTVGGAFTNIGGTLNRGIARLYENGGSDTTFSGPASLTGSINNIAKSSQTGDYYVTGTLGGLFPERSLRLARLAPDGTFDPMFDVGTVNGGVVGTHFFSDVLLATGGFTSFTGKQKVATVLLRVNAAITQPDVVVLTLGSSGGRNVTVTWTSSARASSYVLERADDNDNFWQPVFAGNDSVLSYTDLSVHSGATFQYRIQAFNEAGGSEYSNVVRAVIPGTFEEWLQLNAIAVGTSPDDDTDGDGISLFEEFARGLSPVTWDASVGDSIQIENDRLTLTYHRAQPSLSYTVVASDDLNEWSAVGVDQGGDGPTVTASVPVGTDDRKFLRLIICEEP